jgi:hypothetical protein
VAGASTSNHEKAVMNPLTVNPVIALDHVLGSGPETPGARARTARRPRRSGRAVHAARAARVALERAGL